MPAQPTSTPVYPNGSNGPASWQSYSKVAGRTLASAIAIAAVPLSAQAASFSFGEPGAVGLFRGAGGLFGSSNSTSGPSSIDILADRLNRDLADYALTVGVFDSYDGSIFDFREVGSRQATPFLSSFGDSAGTGLIGYSAGGLSAIRTAKNLAPKPIDLLVQVESFEPLTGSSQEDEVLPTNVETGINYYQNRNRFNPFKQDWDPTDLQGARNVQGSRNIDAEALLGNRRLTHRNILNNTELQQRIVQDVKRNVLEDLTFDRSRKLTLGNGAQTTKNVLRLTPGGQSRSSEAQLSDSIAAQASFESKLTFRMPFETISKGLSYWIGPTPDPNSDQHLKLTFDPILEGDGPAERNKLLLRSPGGGQDSERSPVELNGLDPIRAWVDYNSDTNKYAVFINDSNSKPDRPIFTRTVDLSLLGSEIYFGFQAAGADDGQYAELLSWQLETLGGPQALVEADAVPLVQFAAAGIASENWNGLKSKAGKEETSKSVPEPGLLIALALLGSGLMVSSGRRAAERSSATDANI